MPKHVRFFVLLTAAALSACGTESTQPTALIPAGGPVLELFDPAIEVDVLQRSAPLLHNFAASAVIGRAGGTITLPEAGFAIHFPQNSVFVPTPITVVALPGTAVAYTFQPHGLVFRRPPVIMQELQGTAAYGEPLLRGRLEGAYLPEVSGLTGLTARVREVRPTRVDVERGIMYFDVDHFSTYVASSGRRSGYISASGNLAPRPD